MRFFSRFITFALVLVVATGVGLYFYLHNTEHLKPDLEALIAEQTGIDVKINGRLSWQLLPPLELHIEDVDVTDSDLSAHAAALSLHMDLSAMWQDVNRWKVTALHLEDTTVTNESGNTHISRLDLTDFTPGEPAPLFIQGSYLAAGESQALPGSLEGLVTYQPATESTPESLRLTDAEIASDIGSAVCRIDANENGRNVPEVTPPGDDELLPISTLRRIDLIADCDLTSLTLGTETFNDGSIKITNMTDNLNVFLEVNDFLGGSLITEVDINLAAQPIRWKILPEMDNVDSQRLVDWAEQSVHWIAPLALAGDVEMAGNTQERLLESIRSDQEFNGGQGEIDIAALKAQLAQIAVLTNSSDTVANWPDKWVYEVFTGQLSTRGKKQTLNLQLDNLFIDGEGVYDYATDKINMLAHVTFKEAPEGSPYTVNPLLQDTPLPMRCRGPANDVSCKLDSDATQTLIANALRSDSDTGLRRKLEEKIDDNVPEEYRETARGLLDAIGRAFDRDD